MTKHRVYRLLFWLFAAGMMLAAQPRTLHFSFPDGIGKRGMTYAYPLRMDDTLTTADSLVAGQFTVTHDNAVIDIVGIQKTGSLLDGVADVQFNPVTRILSFANPTPITGTGIFIDLLVTVKASASGTTTTSLQNILLNEGNLLAAIDNGSMRPMDISINPKNPPQDRIVGDTIQFTVTGDVNFPVTWTVGDTHIVSINNTGRVIGKNVGQTTVTVTDNLGLTAQSGLLPIHPPTLRSLTVTLPDLSVMQNLTFLYPVKVSTVTGLGITSAQFRFSYNTSLLTPLGIVKAGTMTDAWSEPTVFYGSNYLDIALAGAEPLVDSGTLVFVQFKVKKTAGFSATVNLSNVLFNENLNATIKNGVFNPTPGPTVTISGKPFNIIIGETAQLSASGGTAPHRWKLHSDPAVASLDSVSGLLTALNRGKAVFSATEQNGFDRFDSLFISDVRFRFPDTSFIYTDSIEYPVTVSSTTGAGIYAAQMVFQFDTAKIRFVSVERGGTLSSGMLMEMKDSAGLRLAFSSAVPLSGSGQFLRLKFRSKGLASIAHNQPMHFQSLLLNESGGAARYGAWNFGSLTITDVPNYAPVFTAKLRDTTINENQPLTFQLKATDANNDTLVFGLFSGSPGMSVSPGGLFSWTPNYNQAGTHKVVVDVGDFRPDGVTKDSAIISVMNVNRSPQFTRIMGDTTIGENQTLSFDIDAFDPDGSAVRYDLVNAREGMTIDSVIGMFSWTPNMQQSGIHDVVIRAKDPEGAMAVREVIITVTNTNVPPMFTRVFNDTTINEDQELLYTVKAIDADNDVIRYSVQNGKPGMQMDSITGVFRWRPSFTQAGTAPISFTAGDGKGGVATHEANIQVLNVNRPPFFTGERPETLFVQTGLSVNVQFTGSDPDNDALTFTMLDAPAASVLTQSGLFTFSPAQTQIGVHRLIVSLSDGTLSVRDTMQIRVTSGNTAPKIVQALPDTTIPEGSMLDFQFTAEDAQMDSLFWTLTGEVPPGASLSAAGRLQWSPSFEQSGSYTIIVKVSDQQFSDVDTAQITVTNMNRAPFFTMRLRDSVLVIDSFYRAFVVVEDPDKDSISLALLKAPAGMQLTATGEVQWTPALTGVDTVIIAASDGAVSVRDTALLTVIGFPVMRYAPSVLDFGITVAGAQPKRSVKVWNDGRLPLIIERLIHQHHEEHFLVSAPETMTIPPGDSLSILVTYTPQQLGTQSAPLHYHSNDQFHPNLEVTMTGTAITVAPVKRRLLVDLTHEPRFPLRDSLHGMTQLFTALQRSGIDVAFAETTFAPAGYDALLLVSPLRMFTETERTALRTFIRDGGLAVMMENATPEADNFVLNELLADSLLGTGMKIRNTLVLDSVHNVGGIPSDPIITRFADSLHPYLRGVDSLVLFGSAIVLTDSTAVPFAATTTPLRSAAEPGWSAGVMGLKKIGKGTLMVIGNTALWQNAPPFLEGESFNIAARDNFAFGLTMFSVEEDYVVKMPTKTPTEVYQLFSLPMTLSGDALLTMLRANLGDINPLKWRLWGKLDPAAFTYKEFPSAGFTSLDRGESYWLITRGEFAIDFGTMTVVPAQEFYPVRIGPGYSMIGNPFPYPVSWKDSRKGDSVETVLWRFDPSVNGFVPESLTLAPFTGYFVKNHAKDSTTLFIDPRNLPLPKQGTAPVMAAHEWQVKIGAVGGKGKDQENIAGMRGGASAGWDRFDISEPPMTPTEYLRLRFLPSAKKEGTTGHAVDMRPMNTLGEYWDFDVTTAAKQTPVRLTLEQSGALPAEFGLYLVDKESERVTRFDRSLSYEFTPVRGRSVHRFRLVAGTQAYVERNTSGIPLIALAHELKQNYPNPFNPSTFIHYTIGHSGIVQLEIFNVLGQKVRLLRNEQQAIGTYHAEWDGKDDAGETVASGVYFYKITVTSNNEKLFTETRKMVLMK